MLAWEFAKALHLQRQHGWARFVSMQDNYNCSPARRNARCSRLPRRGSRHDRLEPARPRPPGPAVGPRPRDDGAPAADTVRRTCYYRRHHQERPRGSRRSRGDSCSNPAACHGHRWRSRGCDRTRSSSPRPSGASSAAQIDDAVASLEIHLTSEEIAGFEAPYTPRHKLQGVSDEAELQKIRDQIPGYEAV